MVVGAPQEVKTFNQTGGLYQCDYSTSTCEPIHLQGESLPLRNPELGFHLCIHSDLSVLPLFWGACGGGPRVPAPQPLCGEQSLPQTRSGTPSVFSSRPGCPLDLLDYRVSQVEVTPAQLLHRPFHLPECNHAHICPLSPTGGCEHVPGPVSGICYQPCPAAGELPLGRGETGGQLS